MHVIFTTRTAGPERLICEAELHFDEDGPLAGMRLVGFSLWQGANDEIFVTFPSRAFGVGGERRYFDYLRGEAAAVKRFKTYVLEAFAALKEEGGFKPAAKAEEGTGTAEGAARDNAGERPHRTRRQ